ncbi:MAG: hypothetical protein HeimC3_31750 [Candidatus Heimdallarchaeota archaeon LC_3]|nr:MAG: hypothetical protein HeimC3_31750 [Candidatus Heimdallarchaeota archaeon LC_3]
MLKAKAIIFILFIMSSGILFSFYLESELSRQNSNPCSIVPLTDLFFNGCINNTNGNITLEFSVEKLSKIHVFDEIIVHVINTHFDGINSIGNYYSISESSLNSSLSGVSNKVILGNFQNDHLIHSVSINISLFVKYIDNTTEEKIITLSYVQQDLQHSILLVIVLNVLVGTIFILITAIRSRSILFSFFSNQKDEIFSKVTTKYSQKSMKKTFHYYPGKYSELLYQKRSLDQSEISSKEQLDSLTNNITFLEDKILPNNKYRELLELFLNIKKATSDLLIILSNIENLNEFISEKSLRSQIKKNLRNFRDQEEDFFYQPQNYLFLDQTITSMVDQGYLLLEKGEIQLSNSNTDQDSIPYFTRLLKRDQSISKDISSNKMLKEINSLRHIDHKDYSVENLLEKLGSANNQILENKIKIEKIQKDLDNNDSELVVVESQIDSFLHQLMTSSKTKTDFIAKSEAQLKLLIREPEKNKQRISEIKSDITFLFSFNK